MLKIKNEIPDGFIDGNNKIYYTEKYIGRIDSVYVDGNITKDFKYEKNTITLENAPNTSISIQYFYRDIEPFEGDGMVLLRDLIMSFYKKIGRIKENGEIPENLNRLYPRQRVMDEIRRSYFRITHKSPIRNNTQTLGFVSNNSFNSNNIIGEKSVAITNSLNLPIEGIFMTENGLIYDYYGDHNGVLKLKDDLILEKNEKIIFGTKLPTGINKIISLKVDGEEYNITDENNFNMHKYGEYTLIKDAQGNQYIFLPYGVGEKIVSLKHNPDLKYLEEEDDIIDIPFEFIDVIILDVAYRLLQEREDERWQAFKMELGDGRRQGLLAEYQKYLKSFDKQRVPKFKLAGTYKNYRFY